MRVLLDTNVLISGILFGGVPRSILERGITGELELVTSPSLMDEFEEVVGEKFRFPSEIARAFPPSFTILTTRCLPPRPLARQRSSSPEIAGFSDWGRIGTSGS